MDQNQSSLIRPLSEFHAIPNEKYWLERYHAVVSVEELEGLLHRGACFSIDMRIFDIYLAYTKPRELNPGGAMSTRLKASSVFYHQILKRFIEKRECHTKEFDIVNSEWNEIAPYLEKIFDFFQIQGTFVINQPFGNDIFEFFEYYLREFLEVDPRVKLYYGMKVLWAKFKDALIASLNGSCSERYANLIVQTGNLWPQEGEYFRSKIFQSIRDDSSDANLSSASDIDVFKWAIAKGGAPRRKAIVCIELGMLFG